jgi:DNA (cytosine-5)-methyltransferase 1
MRFLSLFSGIEAASVAWHPLGWEAVAFSEIEKFPCQLLAQRYPSTPNLGDVTLITEEQIAALGPIDLVVFGSPCQDLSVAGKRKGLLNASGTITRSGLFFNAINIFNWARKHCGARYALWENVPGAFSSNKGLDFASVVSLMAGLDDVEPPKHGWGSEGVALGDNGLLEWAVLDAQWFGVAQRRRRVFALLDTGDWASRPPILLEPHGMRGNTPPSRDARAGSTDGTKVGFDVSHALLASSSRRLDFTAETYVYGIPGNWIGRAPGNGGNATEPMVGISPCLTSTDRHAACSPSAIRRLLAVEWERLQGFPDNYTLISDKTADGPRYKALGNSMAVPVMRWIGERIDLANLFS